MHLSSRLAASGSLALALALGVLPPFVGAATSAGEMCQGQAATIVGTPEQEDVVGTEGDDVIVSGGAARVIALGGDDVICLEESPRFSETRVDAGPGDDTVEAPGPGAHQAVLGTGNDQYDGGAGSDIVRAGGIDGEIETVAHDVVRTGAGSDFVTATTSPARTAFDDLIDLGAGFDTLHLTLPPAISARASIDGGPDPDALFLTSAVSEPAGSDWMLDNVAGTLSTGGTTRLRFAGLENYALDDFAVRSLDFVGGAERETVRGAAIGTADMGAGNDAITLVEPPTGPVDGGVGRDLIVLKTPRATIDLRNGRLDYPAVSRAISGWEDVAVVGDIFRLVGTDGPNAFFARACRLRTSGGKGRDYLRATLASACRGNGLNVFKGGPGNDRAQGFDGRDRLLGGGGKDLLVGNDGDDVMLGGGGSRDKLRGGSGDDRLFGGSGQADLAYGGPGRDLCRAERGAGCER